MENNALITFTMILPIIELCMGIANAVSVKDKIQYPINNPANIHSCDFVPFHAVLNTSDIINLGSIIYNICLLCVDTNVKYIVEKNNFIRGFTAVCGLGGGIYFFCSSYVRRGTV